MYIKYPVILGEMFANHYNIMFPTYKGSESAVFVFKDIDDKEVVIPVKDVENICIMRHGNKRILEVPDWYLSYINYTGRTKNDYMEAVSSYLKMMFKSWFNVTTQDNYNRIYQALTVKYSPIENTDKYAEWSDNHTGSDTNTKTGTDSLARTGNNTDIKSGTDTLQHTGNDKTTDIGSNTLTKEGTETTTKGGTDSIQYGATNTETKNLVDTTTYNGSEVNTAGGADTVGIDKTTTTTHNTTDTTNIAGTETDTLVKSGSILENNDTDVYEYPFNGSTKQATSHTDNRTNTRYGKYKDANGDTTPDEYKETNTKNYNGRSDTTTHTGDDTVVEQGTDTTTYGKTDTKTFTDRNDSLTQTGTDVNAKSGTDTTTYDTSDNLTFTDRKDINSIDTTSTTTYGGIDTQNYNSSLKTDFNSTDTTTYDTTDTSNYGSKMEHIEHTHGNIGVTTNQAMINEELSLRLSKSFLNILADDYCSTILSE